MTPRICNYSSHSLFLPFGSCKNPHPQKTQTRKKKLPKHIFESYQVEGFRSLKLVSGCSCIFPTLLSYVYISKAFPPESVSRYLTMMTMGAGIGFVTTPYITEALLSGFGWRGTLLISSGIFFHLVLIGIVIQFNLPPRSSHDSQKSNGHSWKDPIVIFKNRSYVTFILCMALFGMFGIKIF